METTAFVIKRPEQDTLGGDALLCCSTGWGPLWALPERGVADLASLRGEREGESAAWTGRSEPVFGSEVIICTGNPRESVGSHWDSVSLAGLQDLGTACATQGSIPWR